MKFRAFLITLLLPLCLQLFPAQAQDPHLVTRWAKEATPDNIKAINAMLFAP